MGTFVTLEPPKGPFCPCCGMPIRRPSDSGTGRSSGASRFCRFCAEGRAFTDVAPERDRPAPVGRLVDHPAMRSPKMVRRAIARLKSWTHHGY
jgi:hypothetical protein